MRYQALVENWKDGDVIYGVLDERERVLRAIVEKYAPARHRRYQEGTHNGYATQLPGYLDKRRPMLTQDDLSNAVWSYGEPYRTNEQIRRQLQRAPIGYNFRDFLQAHDRYDVRKRCAQAVEDEIRIQGVLDKAGIEFHVKRGAKVHFVLGEKIEFLWDVARKVPPFGTSRIARTLRWVYRHRYLPEVVAGVRFWNEYARIEFSTMFRDSSWDNYKPSHLYRSWSKTDAQPMGKRSIPGIDRSYKWWEPGGSLRTASMRNSIFVDRHLAKAIEGKFADANDAEYAEQVGSFDGIYALGRGESGKKWVSPREAALPKRAEEAMEVRRNLTSLGDVAVVRRATLSVMRTICQGWRPDDGYALDQAKAAFLKVFPHLGDFEWEEFDALDVD